MDSVDLTNALHKGDCKEVDKLLKGPINFVLKNESQLLGVAVSVNCSNNRFPVEYAEANVENLLNDKRLRNGIKTDDVPYILASAIKAGNFNIVKRLLQEPFIVDAFNSESDVSPIRKVTKTAKENMIDLLQQSKISHYIFPESEQKHTTVASNPNSIFGESSETDSADREFEVRTSPSPKFSTV